MLHLIAHSYAVAAEYAFAVIDGDTGGGTVRVGLCLCVWEAHPGYVKALCKLLELAVAALYAGGAVAAMICKQQFQYIPAIFPQARCVGVYCHSGLGRGGAGGVYIAPVVLYHAHAACAVY